MRPPRPQICVGRICLFLRFSCCHCTAAPQSGIGLLLPSSSPFLLGASTTAKVNLYYREKDFRTQILAVMPPLPEPHFCVVVHQQSLGGVSCRR
jgi:hypothetical protein